MRIYHISCLIINLLSFLLNTDRISNENVQKKGMEESYLLILSSLSDLSELSECQDADLLFYIAMHPEVVDSICQQKMNKYNVILNNVNGNDDKVNGDNMRNKNQSNVESQYSVNNTTVPDTNDTRGVGVLVEVYFWHGMHVLRRGVDHSWSIAKQSFLHAVHLSSTSLVETTTTSEVTSSSVLLPPVVGIKSSHSNGVENGNRGNNPSYRLNGVGGGKPLWDNAAMKVTHNSVLALYMLGWIFELEGDLTGAETCYRSAIDCDFMNVSNNDDVLITQNKSSNSNSANFLLHEDNQNKGDSLILPGSNNILHFMQLQEMATEIYEFIKYLSVKLNKKTHSQATNNHVSKVINGVTDVSNKSNKLNVNGIQSKQKLKRRRLKRSAKVDKLDQLNHLKVLKNNEINQVDLYSSLIVSETLRIRQIKRATSIKRKKRISKYQPINYSIMAHVLYSDDDGDGDDDTDGDYDNDDKCQEGVRNNNNPYVGVHTSDTDTKKQKSFTLTDSMTYMNHRLLLHERIQHLIRIKHADLSKHLVNLPKEPPSRLLYIDPIWRQRFFVSSTICDDWTWLLKSGMDIKTKSTNTNTE